MFDSHDVKNTISIVTVVYNDEENIESTIKSVVNQSYPSIEYIIVDGGSTDGTLDIVRKYSSSIDVMVSEPDAGIYDAMNKGIKLASGNAVTFLNSGDYYVGNVFSDTVSPYRIPFKIKRGAEIRTGRVKFSTKFGMPINHQALVFPMPCYYYNTWYRVSADYDFFLKTVGNKAVPLVDVGGYVVYDNEGFSQKNRALRDYESFLIIKEHYSIGSALLFYCYAKIKSLIKIVYKK